MKNKKRDIKISINRRIQTENHAAIPKHLFEILFRAGCDGALNGDRDAAQWVVDELIMLERNSIKREYNSLRNNSDEVKSLRGKPCVICGKPADTIDHIYPLSKGGTNDISNLQPMCWECNRRKGDSVNS